MNINIITNPEARGLSHDAEELKFICQDSDNSVGVYSWQEDPTKIPRADLSIFCEVVQSLLMKKSKRNWFIPNPELLHKEWLDQIPRFDRVLCKTRTTQRIMEWHTDAAVFTGFASNYMRLDRIERKREFLHIAGASAYKNTEAILGAWRKLRLSSTLYVISKHHSPGWDTVAPVLIKNSISEEELEELMNRCQFHLCPSETEGWGHYIHEAQSCGAVIITNNAPPMNEFGCPENLYVTPSQKSKLEMANVYPCEWQALAGAVGRALALSPGEISEISKKARLRYESDCKFFREKIAELLGELQDAEKALEGSR